MTSDPGSRLDEVRADLDEILDRIDRTFADDADKYEADRQYTLEEVQAKLRNLRNKIGE